MKTKEKLSALLKKKILILDGAMGTMIQTYNLTEDDYRGNLFKHHHIELKGNNDVFSLTKPDIISNIHKQYLEVGADIIETDSFNANVISMAEYGLQDYVSKIAFAAAQLARKAADEMTLKTPEKPRFVAGSIGPTGKSLSLSSDVNNPGYRELTFDDFVVAYKESVMALIKGGVDALIVETVFDTLNCKAALFAIEECFKKLKVQLPIMVSATIAGKNGRLLSGQSLEAFLISISHLPLLSVGLNCSFGAEQMHGLLKELSKKAPFYISCYPNAGLPNEFGQYTQSADIMGKMVERFAQEGLINIIGGCCGTTPSHIKAIAEKVEKYQPRIIPKQKCYCCLSGLEPLEIRPDSLFVNVGERTNVAGSKKFLRLIKEKKYDEALNIARHQVESGAQIIDINMDDGMLDAAVEMTNFLNLIASEPDIAKVPIMLDSSKWEVLEAGLKCLQGKGIINSISLKEGEKKFKERAVLARRYGAAVIVMAFDEKGQADTYERKVEICCRAYKILVDELKFSPQDIIFDPAILAIATGLEEHNNYTLDYIRATKTIKEKCRYCLVSGGVSNLSFSFRGNDTIREMLHSVFLYHAIRAGMDMGIVNPGQLINYEDIPPDILKLIEDVILNRKPDATEKLLRAAPKMGNIAEKDIIGSEWRNLSLEERLTHSIISGITEYLETDIKEAIEMFDSPLEIIEGPLMCGINTVGNLFGEGKMFLPQVIKSAMVMKKAVSFFEPLLKDEQAVTKKKQITGKILMATVKGDVHDIGKNIVDVILRCNNFEVFDIGVMVPVDTIVETAQKENVDVIGLSGLIAPSLDEMVNVAKELEEKKSKIPLMIGGATTSALHTAVKIAPVYNAPVVHVQDASQVVGVLNALLGKESKTYIESINQEYTQLRNDHKLAAENREMLSLEKARENCFKIDCHRHKTTKPEFVGIKQIVDLPLKDLVPFINWEPLFHALDLRGKYPNILSDRKLGAAATKLFKDAKAILTKIIEEKSIKAQAVFGVFPANSLNEEIKVYHDETKNQTLAVLHGLRQQTRKNNGTYNLAFADYVAPEDSKKLDYIGAFIVTAGLGVKNLVTQFKKNKDEYSAILIKALADRLADAFAEYIKTMFKQAFRTQKTLGDGIIVAPGYSMYPDHSEKEILFNLLDAKRLIKVKLTETYMMEPAASICGIYISDPDAKQFTLGPISCDQLESYAKRKGITLKAAEKCLSSVFE